MPTPALARTISGAHPAIGSSTQANVIGSAAGATTPPSARQLAQPRERGHLSALEAGPIAAGAYVPYQFDESLNETLDDETLGTKGSLNAFLNVESSRNPGDPVEKQRAGEEPGWIWMLRCSQVSSGSNPRTHVMHLHSHRASTFAITRGRSSHSMHLYTKKSARIDALLLSTFGPRM